VGENTRNVEGGVDAIALGSRSTVLKLAFILVVGHCEES
jgi:hypothetical protein